MEMPTGKKKKSEIDEIVKNMDRMRKKNCEQTSKSYGF